MFTSQCACYLGLGRSRVSEKEIRAAIQKVPGALGRARGVAIAAPAMGAGARLAAQILLTACPVYGVSGWGEFGRGQH